MPPKRASLWIGAALAIALGAALRLWFIAHASVILGDTFLYGDIALSWMQHGIYGFSQPPADPVPTLIRLPGYPLFLILCFRLFGSEHYTAVLRFQAVIDLLACLVLAALVRRLFGRRAGVIALWVAALCPFTASYVASALTETLTCATVTLAFYALARWCSADASRWTPWSRWLWLLSAALASSILLRPDQGLLAVAVLPAMLWLGRPRSPSGDSAELGKHVPGPQASTGRSAVFRRGSVSLRQGLPVLIAGLCTMLPLTPWTIRNERTFHVFQPLAPRSATDPGDPVARGFDHWFRTWGADFTSTEDVYWNFDGAAIQIADLPSRAFDTPAQYAETAALLWDYNLTAKPTPGIEARFDAIARERIGASWVRYYVVLPVARLINMLFRPRIEMLPVELAWWRYHEHPRETVFAIAYGALNLVYFVLGGLGLVRWLRRPHDPARPIAWAMAAYIGLRCALLLTLDNSEPRYTLEFLPILIVGISALFSGACRRSIHESRLSNRATELVATDDRRSSSYPS